MTVLVKYDERGVPFFAWLLRLAHNAADRSPARAAARRRPRRSSAPTQRADDAAVDRSHCLHEALAALPDEQRSVVVLRHVVGLTPGEIAARLGRTRELDPRPASPRPPRAPGRADQPRLRPVHRDAGGGGMSATHPWPPPRRWRSRSSAWTATTPSCSRSCSARSVTVAEQRRLHARLRRRGLRGRLRGLLRGRRGRRRLLGHRGAGARRCARWASAPATRSSSRRNSFIATAEAVSHRRARRRASSTSTRTPA